jgi:serine/threonine protein kinase
MKTSTLKIIDFSDELKTIDTPTYMAPEIILGNKEMPTFSSDVYCAGVVLWEMLSLESPFAGYRSSQVFQFYNEGRLFQMNDDWPESLKQILGKCLNRNPRKRPSFSEIITYLERIREEFRYKDEKLIELPKSSKFFGIECLVSGNEHLKR